MPIATHGRARANLRYDARNRTELGGTVLKQPEMRRPTLPLLPISSRRGLEFECSKSS
jgi:hypothetical protein